jgi:hypothetical protein
MKSLAFWSTVVFSAVHICRNSEMMVPIGSTNINQIWCQIGTWATLLPVEFCILQYEGVRLPKNIWDPNGYNMTQMILYNYNWSYWSYPNLCMIYIYVHTYYSSIYCWGSKSYPNLCSRGYSMLFQYQLLNNVLSIVPKPGREAPSSAREHTPHTPRLPPLQPVPGLRRSGKHDMSWMQHDSTALSATAWTVSPTGLN